MREDGPAHNGPFTFDRKITMTNDDVKQALAHLVGATYVPELKDTICAITGRSRVVGPTDMCTREFDPTRIQIRTDANQVIQGFEFN